MKTFLIVGIIAMATSASLASDWPDLSSPAAAIGGGEHDAAVVVGIESYFAVPGVPGAEMNAKAWYDYLIRTRGLAPRNVKLLLGVDATREEILSAAREVAGKAGPEGTLWFIFVGHGAPGADGKDGLLVGVDAQQKADSLQARSVKRAELLTVLSASPSHEITVILDACFSGRGQDGGTIAPGLQPLQTVVMGGPVDPRVVVLTAAKGDQFAGALPGGARPAFSYLVLGGLRGWAAGSDRRLTAGDLWRYATGALEATLHGRNQTPDLMGKEAAAMGLSAGEKGPDLASLAKDVSGSGARDFQVTALAAMPRSQAPKALGAAASGFDLSKVDVDALEKYDAAVTLDKSDADPEEKIQSWRGLAEKAPAFKAAAQKRAAEWTLFAAQEKTADEARSKRMGSRDSDWAKLSRLLALGVVPESDKRVWSKRFVGAYLESPGLEAAMAQKLVEHIPSGSAKSALEKLVKEAPAVRITPGKAGISWVGFPGGSFTMGGDGEGPRRRVTVRAFELAKTLVTNKQYQECVQAGACTAAAKADAKFKGDDQPIMGVDWDQAKTFSAWVGGRLPTEAEWEYAARSAGKERIFPWGNEPATCERAVTWDCDKLSAPVCSRPAGNTEQGLCDMAGNAWEWIQDEALDPNGAYRGRGSRGGSWGNPSSSAKIGRRSYGTPSTAYPDYGFRPAR